MAVNMTRSPVAVFSAHLTRAAEQLLRQLPVAPTLPAPELRAWVIQIVNLMLQSPTLWQPARLLLLRAAPLMEQAGHRQDWLRTLAGGYALSRQLNDEATAAELAYHLGVLLRLTADYPSSRAFLQASADFFAANSVPLAQARALNQLAYVCRLMRRHADAQRLAAQAQSLTDDRAEMAYSFFVQGSVALDGQDWPKAIACYERSLALRAQAGDKRLLAWSYGNLGSALRSGQRFDEAIVAFRQAIALYAAIEDPLQRAITEMNLANLHLVCDAPEQALAGYRRAEPIFRRLGDSWQLAAVTLNIGMALRALARWDEAEATLLVSIERWCSLGSVAYQVDGLNELTGLYLQIDEYDKAAQTLRSAADLLAQIRTDPQYEALAATVAQNMARLRNGASFVWTLEAMETKRLSDSLDTIAHSL